MVENGWMHGLLSWQSRIGRGIIILAVNKVASYVSDRLKFHHPGSGTEDQG